MGLVNEFAPVLGGAAGAGVVGTAVARSVKKVTPETIAFRTHSNRARRNRDAILPGVFSRPKANRNTLYIGTEKDDFYEVVGPGNYTALFLRNYVVVTTQHLIDNLGPFAIPYDGTQLGIEAKVHWGVARNSQGNVSDYEAAYRFEFAADGAEARKGAILGICNDGLRKVMIDYGKDPAKAESAEIFDFVKEECAQKLFKNYGVELRDFNLINTAETLPGAIGRQSDMGKLLLGGMGILNGDAQNSNGAYTHLPRLAS